MSTTWLFSSALFLIMFTAYNFGWNSGGLLAVLWFVFDHLNFTCIDLLQFSHISMADPSVGQYPKSLGYLFSTVTDFFLMSLDSSCFVSWGTVAHVDITFVIYFYGSRSGRTFCVHESFVLCVSCCRWIFLQIWIFCGFSWSLIFVCCSFASLRVFCFYAFMSASLWMLFSWRQ